MRRRKSFLPDPKPAGSPRVKGRAHQLRPSRSRRPEAPRGPGPRGRRASPGRGRPFRPQDFYSAELRVSPGAGPVAPVIAPRAGTSRPVVLGCCRCPRARPGLTGAPGPPPADSKPVLGPARGAWPAWKPAPSLPRSARPERGCPTPSATRETREAGLAGGR